MEMDSTDDNYTLSSTLIQDPSNHRVGVVLKTVRTELFRDLDLDNWTWKCIDDPTNSRVILKGVPVKASQAEAPKEPQGSWFPCLTDDSDTETDSPVSPPPRQLTPRKRVTVAKKKRGTGSAQFKSMQAFLQKRVQSQGMGNKRKPPPKDAKEDLEENHSEMPVPPPAKRLREVEDDSPPRRMKSKLIDAPRVVHRKRQSSASISPLRPGPRQG